MTYWAVRPANMPTHIRIEQASDACSACSIAFGRSLPRRDLNVGKYQAKDLGTRVAVIQSDSKRLALLKSPDGWFDPYKEAP